MPSYPTYTIDRISAGEGFAIASMNGSLPLVISPGNPSISLTFIIVALVIFLIVKLAERTKIK